MRNEPIKVLDHGYVQLIEVLGNDATVVNAARVSFAQEIDVISEKDAKLIDYLAKNGHKSPFYHPQLQFRVKAPISVQRQWFKHKVGTAENSESTRYIEVEEEFYIPELMRLQSPSNKQGSQGYLDSAEPYQGPYARQGGLGEYLSKQEVAWEAYYESVTDSYIQYQKLLELGVAKEQARDVLPLCTYTSWVWTASLYSVYNFLQLRDHDHAQEEIRQYAKALRQLTAYDFPISLSALEDWNP